MTIYTGTLKTKDGDELHPATTASVVRLSSGVSVEDRMAELSDISLSETPAAGATPKAGADGKLATGWFPAGIGGLNAGGSDILEISANLELDSTSPRKLAVSALTSGLKIFLPDVSTLEEDGVSFIVVNYGICSIKVLDHTWHMLGTNNGDVEPNEARAYVLLDKAAGTWAIMNLSYGTINAPGDASGFVLVPETPVVFKSSATMCTEAVALSSTQILVVYMDSSSSYYGKAVIISLSGTTISIGTPCIFEQAQISEMALVAVSPTKAVVAYSDVGNANYGTAAVLSVSGTTITAGTPVVFSSIMSGRFTASVLSSDRVLVTFLTRISTVCAGKAIVLLVSEMTIVPGTAVSYENEALTSTTSVALSSTKALIIYTDNSNSRYITAILLSIDGTVITVGAPVVLVSSQTGNLAVAGLSDTKVIVTYKDVNNSNLGTAIVLSVLGETLTAGTPVVFSEAAIDHNSIVAISDNRVLVAYKEYISSHQGKAVVLYAPGLEILAETPVAFVDTEVYYTSSVALTDTALMVVYCDNTNSLYGNICLITRN